MFEGFLSVGLLLTQLPAFKDTTGSSISMNSYGSLFACDFLLIIYFFTLWKATMQILLRTSLASVCRIYPIKHQICHNYTFLYYYPWAIYKFVRRKTQQGILTSIWILILVSFPWLKFLYPKGRREKTLYRKEIRRSSEEKARRDGLDKRKGKMQVPRLHNSV